MKWATLWLKDAYINPFNPASALYILSIKISTDASMCAPGTGYLKGHELTYIFVLRTIRVYNAVRINNIILS